MTSHPIRSLKLKQPDFGDEWSERVEDKLNYDELIADPRWRKDWISFDGVVYHAATNRVYCGLTSFDTDIFKFFDRKTGAFCDTDFAAVANSYDAKFHRSMQLTNDGETLGVRV